MLLKFDAKAATGLSQASILGSSVGGVILNLRNKHPHANRPLIDLDLALLLAPLQMAGAIVRMIVNLTLVVFVFL